MSKDQSAHLFDVEVDLERLHRRDREYLTDMNLSQNWRLVDVGVGFG